MPGGWVLFHKGGLNGDVQHDRVWLSGIFVLNMQGIDFIILS